ncbi:MAG: AAA family ATPase [Lentisphaerae bacterium]|jgi:predicted ATPase|nr:AAA family ATPase [Lentisphaerota bacterium]
MGSIKRISINGFKSIRELKDFELKDLNVIVGANGAGKSNFIQIFKMVRAMSQGAFQEFILKNGGADAFPFDGLKETPEIKIGFEFTSNNPDSVGSNFYRFSMTSTASETMLLSEECKDKDDHWKSYGSASLESRLSEQKNVCARDRKRNDAGYFIYDVISQWMVYHFHDTSSSAPMRRTEIIEDHKKLRGDGSNVAPFLLHLRENAPQYYEKIRNAIQLVIPFFDDFSLDIIKQGEAEKVKLTWKQKGTDYPMQPYHFSDGSIRFICLATALMQPNPPTAIVIDEPELGLHPEAIHVLAELITLAAKRTQVIIATQSSLLLDNFAIDDIIVAKRNQGATTFERLKEKDYNVWLEDYSVGELWTRDIIHGGTIYE